MSGWGEGAVVEAALAGVLVAGLAAALAPGSWLVAGIPGGVFSLGALVVGVPG